MSRANIFNEAAANSHLRGTLRNAANIVTDTLGGQNRASLQSAISFFSETVMRNPTPETMNLVELATDLAGTTLNSRR